MKKFLAPELMSMFSMTGEKCSKEKFNKLNMNSLIIGKKILFLKKVPSDEN